MATITFSPSFREEVAALVYREGSDHKRDNGYIGRIVALKGGKLFQAHNERTGEVSHLFSALRHAENAFRYGF